MATTTVEETQVKKAAAKGQREGSEATPEMSASSSNPLEELRKQADLAYSSYLGAQRKVAKAYREREQAEVASYKEVEERANRECDETIKRALATRTERDRSAKELYEKALEASAHEYEAIVDEALKVCRQTVQQQWQVANELSDQIWNIFQGNM